MMPFVVTASGKRGEGTKGEGTVYVRDQGLRPTRKAALSV